MRLSIIIPMYNTNEYVDKLLDKLDEQIKQDVEVILIDDGSDIPYSPKNVYMWLKLIRLDSNSGGASKPRNIGLDKATGDYITFIDSDDMVTDDYIEKILDVMKKNKDIIFLSWQSKIQKVIMRVKPPRWNCSVWCRVYHRRIINNIRFDENLKIAEDWKFNEQAKYRNNACIKTVVYLYNNGRKGSLLNGGGK